MKAIVDTYFEYSFEEESGVYSEAEYKSYYDALDAAHEWFEQKCFDEGISRGETREDTVTIVQLYVDDEGQEHLMTKYTNIEVTFEYLGSGREQHFNQRDYV